MPAVPVPPRRAAFGRHAARANTPLLLRPATGERFKNRPALAAEEATSVGAA
jgi:hypothetical protein